MALSHHTTNRNTVAVAYTKSANASSSFPTLPTHVIYFLSLPLTIHRSLPLTVVLSLPLTIIFSLQHFFPSSPLRSPPLSLPFLFHPSFAKHCNPPFHSYRNFSCPTVIQAPPQLFLIRPSLPSPVSPPFFFPSGLHDNLFTFFFPPTLSA